MSSRPPRGKRPLPPADPRAIKKAFRLRKKMTPEEEILWEYLRAGRLGIRFRRQYPTGPYILDFVSLSERIVIEIDGPWHDCTSEREIRREEFLKSHGFRVLHFSNDDVLHRTSWVLEVIRSVVDGGF